MYTIVADLLRQHPASLALHAFAASQMHQIRDDGSSADEAEGRDEEVEEVEEVEEDDEEASAGEGPPSWLEGLVGRATLRQLETNDETLTALEIGASEWINDSRRWPRHCTGTRR